MKNSWQTHIQESYIEHDHAYCKPPKEKPKKKLVQVVEEDIDFNPGEILVEEAQVTLESTLIFNEEEIEVSEMAEVFIQNKASEQSPCAIPIVKTTTPNAVPVRCIIDSTRPSKNKCIILHDCPSIIVNEQKLSPFFDIECIQVNSLRKISSRKNLNNICNTIMDTKPEAIFIHLGYTDLRRRADVDVSVKNYDCLLRELARATDANICATMLKQTHGYEDLNYSIKHFNNDIKCLIANRRTTIEGSKQFFIEEEQFVIEGIGSKSEVIEQFAYMIPPEDEVKEQSVPIPSVPGPSSGFESNLLHPSGRPTAHQAPATAIGKPGRQPRFSNLTRDYNRTSSRHSKDRNEIQQNIKVLGNRDKKHSSGKSDPAEASTQKDQELPESNNHTGPIESKSSSLGTKRKLSNNNEGRREATTSTASKSDGQGSNKSPSNAEKNEVCKEKTPATDQDVIPPTNSRATPANSTQGENVSTKNLGNNEPEEKPPELHAQAGPQTPGTTRTPNPNQQFHRKCLLVHDDFFNEFDWTKFSSRFEISTYRAFSVDDIVSRGGLVSKVRNIKPEVVFMHAGFQDLFWLKVSADNLFNKYKQTVYKILESTTAKLCLSTIIPIPGYPRLNEEIESFNGLLTTFVSNLRSGQKYRNRVFTSCNKNLGGFINRGTGKNGVELSLSERGQRKAWLTFRDSLERALDIKISYGQNRNETGFKPKRNRNE